MPDIAVRLRHPKGTTTLSFDPSITSVDDLRGLIFSACEIPPEEQEIKYSYPPKPLPTLSSGQTLSSIPITKGEQLLVTIATPSSSISKPSSAPAPAPAPSLPLPLPAQVTASTSTSTSTPSGGGVTPAPSVKRLNETLSAPGRLTPASQIGSAAPSPAPRTGPGPGQSGGSRTSGNGQSGAKEKRGKVSVTLPRDLGSLELRKVPDDNSCLFSAIAVVFEGGIEGAGGLRKVVVDAIRKDPETYSEVMLGKPVEEYIQAISKSDTWGGAIELSIFSTHYQTEISSFDVQSSRVDRFGESQGFQNRCLLVYSGIHYDALSLSPMADAPASFHTTVFPVHDDSVLDAARELVGKLKEQHYYTDTATFDLRCGVCGEGLKGEKGAREHAMNTGHVEFGEY